VILRIFLLCALLLAADIARAATCLTGDCHRNLRDVGQRHAPAHAGNCLSCHTSHTATSQSRLVAPPTELCLACHEKIAAGMQRFKTRHAPLYREESCLLCHDPHASAQQALLRAPQRELCLTCHGRDDFTTSQPLRNIDRELQGKALIHQPLTTGDCAACHAAHGSDFHRLLNARYPSDFYAPYRPGIYDFCFQCHDQELLLAAKTTTATRFRHGTRNLHFLHVADPRKGRSCRACHQAHAGGAHLLVDAGGADFGDWRIPLRVQLSATGGRCFPGCHTAVDYDRDFRDSANDPSSAPAGAAE